MKTGKYWLLLENEKEIACSYEKQVIQDISNTKRVENPEKEYAIAEIFCTIEKQKVFPDKWILNEKEKNHNWSVYLYFVNADVNEELGEKIKSYSLEYEVDYDIPNETHTLVYGKAKNLVKWFSENMFDYSGAFGYTVEEQMEKAQLEKEV